MDKYSRVRICLDTGRLHLQSKIDSAFNDIDIVQRFSKYTDVVHLWNQKVGGIGHYPALPALKAEDGWAPIFEYLKIIANEKRNIKVMFEHRSDLISDDELNSCYSWVKDLLETKA